MKAIIWTAVFLMCAMALVAQESGSAQSVAAPGGQATLADFKGEVTVRFEDQTTPAAARGMALPANAILETGKKGSALLGMKDGSQVLVRSNTRVQIKATEDSQGHWFELLIGKIRAKVRKHLGEQAPFRLGTPSAVITVRGTDFVVEVNDKNGTYVYVSEGVVEFAGLGALDRPVLIKSGFQSQVVPNGVPDPPRSDRSDFSRDGQSDRTGRQTNDDSAEGRDSQRTGERSSPEREDSHPRETERTGKPD